MPLRVLLSGPAGGGKSQEGRRLLAAASGAAVLVDFQAIYAALAGAERGPDGLYPARNEALLPIAEYVRRAAITGARERELDVVATNSDGDAVRRASLLTAMGDRRGRAGCGPGPRGRRGAPQRTGRAVVRRLRRRGRQMVWTASVTDVLSIPIEWREDAERRGPGHLRGVLVNYGERARDRAEMFADGALRWDPAGVVLNRQHSRQAPIVRFLPKVEGRAVLVDVELPDTVAGRDAASEVRGGLFKGLSMEFRTIRQAYEGGVRIVKEALLTGAGLVDSPAYRAAVEVRGEAKRRRLWL